MPGAVFWVAAGGGYGGGHLARTLAVTRRLGSDWDVYIVVPQNDYTREVSLPSYVAGAARVRLLLLPAWENVQALIRLVDTSRARSSLPALVVTDRPHVISADDIRSLRSEWGNGCRIAVIGNEEAPPVGEDLRVIPDPGATATLLTLPPWNTPPTRCVGGGEFVVLGHDWPPKPICPPHRPPRVLVTAGNADPGKLTSLFLTALEKVALSLEATVIIGRGFQHRNALMRQWQGRNDRFRLVENVDDLGPYMAAADVALAAFGITVLELLHVGVPTITVTHTRDDLAYAGRLEAMELLRVAGAAKDTEPTQIAATLRRLLQDHDQLRLLAAKGQSAVDGQGDRRVAAELIRLCR